MWIVNADTESGDQYSWIFDKKPTRDQIVTLVWKMEGECAEEDYYDCTLSITYEEAVLLKVEDL